MNLYIITAKMLKRYKEHLYRAEKVPNTIEKYLHDVGALLDYVGDTVLTKEILLKYKANLTKRYKVSSVNSILSALNSFFRWCGWEHLLLKTLRVQRSAFRDKNRELSKAQYFRLLNVAQDKGDLSLWLLMQTLCATGIRPIPLGFYWWRGRIIIFYQKIHGIFLPALTILPLHTAQRSTFFRVFFVYL